MRTSRPRFFLQFALFPVFALATLSVRAQISATPSLRSSTPSDIERDAGVVAQIIERAEAHYRQGELNLKDRNPEAARSEFMKLDRPVIETDFHWTDAGLPAINMANGHAEPARV